VGGGVWTRAGKTIKARNENFFLWGFPHREMREEMCVMLHGGGEKKRNPG